MIVQLTGGWYALDLGYVYLFFPQWGDNDNARKSR